MSSGERDVVIGQSVAALFTRHEPFVLVEGPAGTGKTRAILTVLLLRALRWGGSKILLTRKHRTDLTRTVLATLEDQVFPAFGLEVPGGANRENRSQYVLPNKSLLVPAGVDEGQKLFSSEWTFIYGAESTELTETQVGQLARSMRNFSAPFQQCILDCNPGAPGHWLNKRAEDVPDTLRNVFTREDYARLQAHNRTPAADPLRRWKRIVTKYQDNPGYWDHARWDWTREGRHYYDTNLGVLTGFLAARLKAGLWVGAEGTVYREFSEALHVVKPFPIPAHWPHYVGWDPGYDHPTAILWFAVAPNGCLYIVDEIYEGGKGVDAHCAHVHKRNAGRTVRDYFGDPQHAFSSTAQAPDSIATQAAKCGIRMRRWKRTAGEEEAMVNKVREKLTHRGEGGLPDPMLKVFSTCTNTIGEFQSWSYKRTAAGELPPGEDAFEDKQNHCMDVVKGCVSMNLRFEAGSIEVVGG